MSTVRSYENNGQFVLTDLTEDLLVVPNRWGLFQQLGIFGVQPVTQHTITVERIEKSLALIGDQPRGARNQVSKDYQRAMHTFPVPHFPLDDFLLPQDVQGKRAYGTPDRAETEAMAIARKVERIRESHSQQLETARAYAINNGSMYAPNGYFGTVNWYTSFGFTRQDVDYAFGTTTTDLIAKGESGIAYIQDNLKTGQVATDFIAVCSPTFFNALIGHATVKEAYKYYSSNQEPLRRRLNAIGLDGRYRAFEYGGILYIEYRGVGVDGSAYITAGEARLFPLGIRDAFETYFSPANKFGLVNTLGEEAYLWEYRGIKDDKIEFESESNYTNMLRYPQIVVRLHSSTGL